MVETAELTLANIYPFFLKGGMKYGENGLKLAELAHLENFVINFKNILLSYTTLNIN